MVGENNSKIFEDFLVIFPNKKYDESFKELEQSIKSLDISQFSSIIDSDMYLLGLIYRVAFENKKIDETRKANLSQELAETVEGFKKDYSHRKTPSALKYLRTRISESIAIYTKYTK